MFSFQYASQVLNTEKAEMAEMAETIAFDDNIVSDLSTDSAVATF